MLVKFVFEVPDDFQKGDGWCGFIRRYHTLTCPLNSETCNKYNCPLEIVDINEKLNEETPIDSMYLEPREPLTKEQRQEIYDKIQEEKKEGVIW